MLFFDESISEKRFNTTIEKISMHHINSKNNASYCRQGDRNWQKQLSLNAKKSSSPNNLEAVKFSGNFQLKPGNCTVFLTLLLLSSVVTVEAGTVKAKAHPKPSGVENSAVGGASSQSSLSTTSDDIGAAALTFLTLAQLMDTKVKIDPVIPAKFHKDLQCDKVKEKLRQTVESFPTSEAPIKRVLGQPEFEMRCSTSERMKELIGDPSVAYFNLAEKKMYVTNEALDTKLISHEFIHADHLFRHTQAPFEEKDRIKALLPIYPASKENIKNYQQALDKGDERINDFKMLKEKVANKEKLSRAQKKRLNNYEYAAKDCLYDCMFKDIYPPAAYDRFLAAGWKPGLKGFGVKTREGLDAEILDMKRTSEGTLIIT